MSPETLCVGPSNVLLQFVQEIFSYGFKDEPNYPWLKHHLVKVLLCHNILPTQKLDWSKFKLPKVKCEDSVHSSKKRKS